MKGERDMVRVSLNVHKLMAQGDLLLVDQPQRKAFVAHQAEEMKGVRQ